MELLLIILLFYVLNKDTGGTGRGCNTNTPPEDYPTERPTGITNPTGIVTSELPRTQ